MTQDVETIDPLHDDAPHPASAGERAGDMPRGIPLDVFWARLDPPIA